MAALCEALSRPMPELAEDEFTRLDTAGLGVAAGRVWSGLGVAMCSRLAHVGEALTQHDLAPAPSLAFCFWRTFGEAAPVVWHVQCGEKAEGEDEVFDDQELRAFYLSLPDIK